MDEALGSCGQAAVQHEAVFLNGGVGSKWGRRKRKRTQSRKRKEEMGDEEGTLELRSQGKTL